MSFDQELEEENFQDGMNENYINMTNLNKPLMNRPSIVPLSKVKGSIYEESEIDLDDSEDMEDHQKKY